MTPPRLILATVLLAVLTLSAGCGAFREARLDPEAGVVSGGRESPGDKAAAGTSESVLDIFRQRNDGVKVNRYLWTASLEVLDFLPVEAADPFTGLISTGYGTPPGGGTEYRATILISDPALDARSVNVSLQTRRGAVDPATQRVVEDAILTRARQLRVQAENF